MLVFVGSQNHKVLFCRQHSLGQYPASPLSYQINIPASSYHRRLLVPVRHDLICLSNEIAATVVLATKQQMLARQIAKPLIPNPNLMRKLWLDLVGSSLARNVSEMLEYK